MGVKGKQCMLGRKNGCWVTTKRTCTSVMYTCVFDRKKFDDPVQWKKSKLFPDKTHFAIDQLYIFYKFHLCEQRCQHSYTLSAIITTDISLVVRRTLRDLYCNHTTCPLIIYKWKCSHVKYPSMDNLRKKIMSALRSCFAHLVHLCCILTLNKRGKVVHFSFYFSQCLGKC